MNMKAFIPLCLALILSPKLAQAVEYTLAIQPVLPPDQLEAAYKPLTDYLSAKTGSTIKIKTFSTFKSYWYGMKRHKGFDMVLDAAHFTDYRVKHDNYRVIAKLPETVSFTVVTKSDLFVFDVEELASYRVASMVAPGVGGLRLKEMFLGAEKSPTTISCYDSNHCVKLIREGKADAAIIPTPMVASYDNLNVVTTTEPMPHTAFSVSADVPEKVADAIQAALVGASKTDEGKEMLAALKFAAFDLASNQTYDGYADILAVMKKR